MSETNVYGPIVSTAAVEKLVVASLDDWLTYYLGEQERIDGWDADSIERPKGVIRVTDLEKWPEDQIPLVVVMCGAVTSKKRQDGDYEGVFPVTVGIVASDLTRESSRDLAASYCAAIRAAVVQHKRLKSTAYPEGIEGSVHWTGETPNPIIGGEASTLAGGAVSFDVALDTVVQTGAGPRTIPPTPPNIDPGDWPGLKPGQPTVIVEPVEVLP